MLNGVDPLLIIVIKKNPPTDLLAPPVTVFEQFLDFIGIPIPIYLTENPAALLGLNPQGKAAVELSRAGIYVESETRAIDVSTIVEPVTTTNPLTGDTATANVTQRAVDTQVTVNLIASRDSILITALIAIMEFLVNRLVTKEYSIHYINKSTVIFGGLLHRFATSSNPNEDKIHIELTLSTSAKTLPVPKAGPPGIANTSTTSLTSPPGT